MKTGQKIIPKTSFRKNFNNKNADGNNTFSTKIFTNDEWAIVTPKGHYDTNTPGDLPCISWVITDAPLTPLPVEIFMRDYFEPRLLSRLLKGESLPTIKSVGELNHVQ